MPEPSPQFFEPQPAVPGTPAGPVGPIPAGPPTSTTPPPDPFGTADAAALWEAAAAAAATPTGAGPVRRVRAWWGRLVRHRLWRNRRFRIGALISLLAVCGLVILALVRDQTGTEGFLVGLALAVLPVPLLAGVFRWLDRVDPGPYSNLVFAFAWGAFAAALVAIIANSFATEALALATSDPSGAQSVGAIAIAPVVEESAKGTGVLLLFLFRRRHFTGIVDGIVFAGLTATGFAFTENILYLGKAFGEDQHTGGAFASFTAATFFVRIVLSPFAHPLFTTLTGAGFGFSALATTPVRRVLLPLGGLILAMGMHALWNSASAAPGPYGFYVVYALVMMPVFGLVTWLAVWARQHDLRIVAARLAAYVAAGWLVPAAPFALSSMRARTSARDLVGRTYGSAAAKAVTEYERWATTLALLRNQTERNVPVPDFAERERDLLGRMWERGALAGPALTYAARATGRVRVPPPYVDYEGFNPYRYY